MHKLLLIFLLISTHAISSDSLDSFQKRFKIIKNDKGNVTYVQMNFLNQKFSIMPYVNQVIKDLKDEIKNLRTKNGESEIEDFIAELEAGISVKDEEAVENIYTLRRSLRELKNVHNLDELVLPIKKSKILIKFQKDLQEALNKFSLVNIASTEDARYFYKRNVTYEVLTKALEFAKNRFSSLPVLNIASFLLVKVHGLILEQRSFHQNMLLHYLETYPEDRLGLTLKEADLIYSSIYESRITYLDIFESNRAAKNWALYGVNIFYSNLRTANNKLRRFQAQTSSEHRRYNYAFVEMKIGEDRVVKNLFDNQHKFSSKMSTAYNYSKPNAVKRFRTLLNLGQIGLSMIPIPAWLKGQVESFLESYYVKQRLTEGALVGFFESNGNLVMAKNIVKQMSNPYIKF